VFALCDEVSDKKAPYLSEPCDRSERGKKFLQRENHLIGDLLSLIFLGKSGEKFPFLWRKKAFFRGVWKGRGGKRGPRVGESPGKPDGCSKPYQRERGEGARRGKNFILLLTWQREDRTAGRWDLYSAVETRRTQYTESRPHSSTTRREKKVKKKVFIRAVQEGEKGRLNTLMEGEKNSASRTDRAATTRKERPSRESRSNTHQASRAMGERGGRPDVIYLLQDTTRRILHAEVLW